MSATSFSWARDHRSDGIELIADKEIFCGVQMNINGDAYFQIFPFTFVGIIYG